MNCGRGRASTGISRRPHWVSNWMHQSPAWLLKDGFRSPEELAAQSDRQIVPPASASSILWCMTRQAGPSSNGEIIMRALYRPQLLLCCRRCGHLFVSFVVVQFAKGASGGARDRPAPSGAIPAATFEDSGAATIRRAQPGRRRPATLRRIKYRGAQGSRSEFSSASKTVRLRKAGAGAFLCVWNSSRFDSDQSYFATSPC